MLSNCCVTLVTWGCWRDTAEGRGLLGLVDFVLPFLPPHPLPPTQQLWPPLQRIAIAALPQRRLLWVPGTARRSNWSILKEINLGYSLEGLMLKLQYFGHLMERINSLVKTLMLGKVEGRRRRGMTEDEMVRWHHWLHGHEFEQTLGDSEEQGNLACCSSWGHNESDRT